jgi:anti-sigma regulatory factor (Ser/Thr protein kinase)
MDPVLIDAWLSGAASTPMLDEASIVLLRQRVRTEATKLGFSEIELGSIVNVASELAHNQLAHARGGRIAVRPIEREGIAGIEVIAPDRGPGIASPTEALKGRPFSPPPVGSGARASLGVGLASSLHLADELDFDVRMGEGTCIWARKFTKHVPRRRRVGIYGRPLPGEDQCGDDAGFVRSDDSLLVGVMDGLGHGPPAREASGVAMDVVRRGTGHEIDRIVQDCHDALRGTRGGVMAVARIGEQDQALRAAVFGDVSLQIEGPGTHRRVMARSFVLGAPGPRPKTVVEESTLGKRDVVILFTDGISARADLQADPDLLREHPIVIAHQLVERFARDNDDALVVVVA